jgi:transcriptional regulator with XRE-family HTH domain
MRKSQHTREYRRLTDALRRARLTAGLTQAQAASRIGVYANYISKIESGERRIDVVELSALCRVYDYDIVGFLAEAGLTGRRER